MANKNKRNNNNSKVRTTKQVEQGFFEGLGKWELVSFSVGFIVAILAIFMIVAFVSYLFTGGQDYDLIEHASEMANEQNQYKNVCGSAGAWLAYYFLNDLFGLASLLIPPYLIVVGMRLMRIFKFTLVRKFILTVLLMLWVSVFFGAFSVMIPQLSDSFLNLGGNHGKNVAQFLMNTIGGPGLMLVLVVYAVGYLIYLSARTIEIIRKVFRFKFFSIEKIRGFVSFKTGDDDEEDDGNASDAEDTTAADEENGDHSSDIVSESESVPHDDTPLELNFDENGYLVGDNSREGVVGHSQQTSILFGDDENGNDTVDNDNEDDENVGDDAQNLEIEANETEKGSGEIERGNINTPYDPKLDLEMYKYPTLDLLAKSDAATSPAVDLAEQNANKDRIIHVLKNFGVEISSIKATIGPTITLYEIVPAEGTRISKIRNLEDDIALSLAAEGIRIIAPIPGKGTIGIEVPNKKKCMVSMESVINSKTYQESKMELPCAIGKTIQNEVYMFDLAKAPHLLVAGATGQGKSVGLNAIVTSLLYKKHPAELKIVMVDPKKVEFSIYSPIENHFLARLEDEEECIITDVQKVVKTLNSLCALMDTRYDMLKKAHVRNIKEYNEKFKKRELNPENGHEFMPYIVVIVDEFGDLIMTAGKEVELPICRIAQLARAVGIHMIIATQRPQASIISGAIKANFPARIAFKVQSMMDSRVILDCTGANQLIGKGDMLYLQGGDPVRVQCAFVDTPEVNNICSHIARQQSYLHPLYLPEVAEGDGDGGGSMGGNFDKGHLDPMFADVARFVVSNQSGSTSMIQRHFSIGYNRAGKIMDQLEKMGVVGPQIGSKPRQLMIQDTATLDSLLNNI